MTVAANLGYMLGVLCLGALAKRLGLLDSGRRDKLTFFAFAFALPALVFTSTYDQPIREVIEPTLVLGFWLVLFTMLAVGWEGFWGSLLLPCLLVALQLARRPDGSPLEDTVDALAQARAAPRLVLLLVGNALATGSIVTACIERGCCLDDEATLASCRATGFPNATGV